MSETLRHIDTILDNLHRQILHAERCSHEARHDAMKYFDVKCCKCHPEIMDSQLARIKMYYFCDKHGRNVMGDDWI